MDSGPAMLSRVVLAILFAIVSTTGQAQVINLVCGGTMIHYEPKRTEGVVSSSATTVDLEGRIIGTPVGRFRIHHVEETAIYFDAPTSNLVVYGNLDRLSGRMTIMWSRPEEDAKLKAGMTSRNSMYADLKCSVGRRLF